MSNAPVDNGRRRFLTIATSVVGGVGAAGAAVPFIASWNPSERAKSAGAPVEVDISKLEPGQLIRVEWRGKPVWVVSRTPKMLEQMKGHEDQLRDPHSQEPQQLESSTNDYRSLRPEIFLAVGICTHLGCSPSFLQGGFGEKVEGTDDGFYCPCHGSKFDMAGRVFQSVPAPLNLEIPPYTFLDETTILVGEEQGVA
ncbi:MULTISPECIES: ubiquinol-cytochrome c reductase iron-sulfur subunit [Pseudoalteromonas]|uniref:Ubiquinol-cytochrome c reductase iron-sulfur subunit n=4 Tax=Pseudoalteromonas TaxID=53246 RepID=Q3IG28_PSET1|nr:MULTISPECIES: ubiquinol-cytochrome c reductase iron-sulfur subunit [Pseudoalteromonas]ALS34071.1 ubiquinol-cytochrome c reductase iron-sulfur subunit [Pseudoalteromonas translucida KMM 520]ASM55148.1 ubiquinol-cytochrome c reductase iron-sulfur subunit [Pseudoalteromonas nigrifaciens]MBB1369310.1 ubiquinol-cytochrome c reductase iron-sulfur subunit [Pseudoalteromonas sp. SR45-4]MBB1405741.1 ubiquinol-cytochrome c reductase iron-sulfur subunit [Pseudoalteromonas sp. SG44-5]MBE0419798.1 ubiqu|tara:strand:- start:8035 stop:8625 length:591 start_codon:yes stop_codon:yes gene_type:complete